ncbi:Peroxisomal coenzyme A diphosphatase ndx-8, partial [Trichostrongylus colubriformis]
EVGLRRDDFILLGSLPSFRARFGVLIHPTVALLRRPFLPRLNAQEVRDTFWMPLERFLDNTLHMSFVIDNKYAVHSFSFEEAHTYGVTALMCIVTAMGVLQKMPPFDIAPFLPVSRLATMTPAEVMSEVCEYAGQPFKSLSKL